MFVISDLGDAVNTTDTNAAAGRTPVALPLWVRVAGGIPLLCLGAAIAVYMGIAVILEIMTDDGFGMAIACLVVVFGCILVREGFFLLRGYRPERLNAQPSDYHRAAYARTNMHPLGAPPDASRCAAVVYKEWQCPNPRGHGPQRAFCRKHAAAFEAGEPATLETTTVLR